MTPDIYCLWSKPFTLHFPASTFYKDGRLDQELSDHCSKRHLAVMATPSESCPVDHTARQAWLDQAAFVRPPSSPHPQTHFSLDESRQVSSIPRLVPFDPSIPTPGSTHGPPSSATKPTSLTSSHASTNSIPANAEHNSLTSSSGNWIYPSQRMFYDAMQRKQHDPHAPDMATVVPIHNAVNERAWKEILKWEAPYMSSCLDQTPARDSSSPSTHIPRQIPDTKAAKTTDTVRGDALQGPKLVSFSGTAKSLTPRARWNSLLGYTRPFDRHDWIVDRAGTRVDYVIDFYAGKPSASATGHQRPEANADPKQSPLNFYLDVRPKLNTIEGCRMRLAALFGV